MARCPLALALVALASCETPSYTAIPDVVTCRAMTPLVPVGASVFGDDGRAGPFALPAGAHLLAVTLSDPSRCVQVDALTLDDGTALVTPGDFGPTCVRCFQRVSVMQGAGWFAIPSDASRLGPSRVTLALRDCATGASLRPLPSGVRATVARVALDDATPGATGALDLAVIATPSSWLARADDASLRRFERDVSAELADAALRVRVVARCVLPPSVADEVTVQAGEGATLADLTARAASACRGFEASAPRITVWGVRCLTVRNATLGETTSPEGFTTHVPGGGATSSVADGVVLSDGCFAIPPGTEAPPHAVRVMAHELGHYLGLYHSVEADGRADVLDDTDASNLMNARPTEAMARGLSRQQATIVRRHPAVRWSAVDGGVCEGR